MDSICVKELPAMTKGKAQLPLLGLTILLVEDSRYCSEAVRLICLQSGARLRRADTLAAAHRHVATYRPSLVLIDIGLPDGSGLDLVKKLARQPAVAPVILVTSGDDPWLATQMALRAGADGFLSKPLTNIREFQKSILKHFPERAGVLSSRVVPLVPNVAPDLLSVSEDIRQVCDLLTATTGDMDHAKLMYCAQFLRSVAEARDDENLAEMAEQIVDLPYSGHASKEHIGSVIGKLENYIAVNAPVCLLGDHDPAH